MILSQFREAYIKKKIDKGLLKSDESLNHITGKKINSTLVVIDENTAKNSIQIIAKELKINASKIKVLNYIKDLPKKNDSEEVLTNKDFSLFGKIKKVYIQNLVDSEFDLLINLSTNKLFLNYLVMLSKARFKVGFSNDDNRLYDFMIAVDPNDVKTFSSELKKYLKILNKL